MHADYELGDDGNIEPIHTGRGGARLGAGRKPPGYEAPPAAKALAESKARKEAALADMHELDFKIKSGQYLPRQAFKDASATILASVAQTLRSLPDNLERKFNLKPEQAEEITRVIDATLADAAAGLEMLTSE